MWCAIINNHRFLLHSHPPIPNPQMQRDEGEAYWPVPKTSQTGTGQSPWLLSRATATAPPQSLRFETEIDCQMEDEAVKLTEVLGGAVVKLTTLTLTWKVEGKNLNSKKELTTYSSSNTGSISLSPSAPDSHSPCPNYLLCLLQHGLCRRLWVPVQLPIAIVLVIRSIKSYETVKIYSSMLVDFIALFFQDCFLRLSHHS